MGGWWESGRGFAQERKKRWLPDLGAGVSICKDKALVPGRCCRLLAVFAVLLRLDRAPTRYSSRRNSTHLRQGVEISKVQKLRMSHHVFSLPHTFLFPYLMVYQVVRIHVSLARADMQH